MDFLDIIDLGASRTFGRRLKRAASLAGAVLMCGWVFKWPVIHPLVQGVLDQRAQHLTDLIIEQLDGN